MAVISSYLKTIETAESGESVRDAISNALEEINNDNPVSVKPLNVTANGTYTGEQGMAYNPVTVNVEGGGSSVINFNTLKATENGYYEAASGTAYSGVQVDVPQNTAELGEKIIEADGTFNASDDGLDGYSKVVVITGQSHGGPYTVRFYNGDQLLQVVGNVPYGGGATYSGALPTSSGMTFIGWQPSPTNVTSDMDCYARFVDPSGESTITDTWAQIAKNVQSNPSYYPLNSTKLMEFPVGVDYYGNKFVPGVATVRLIGIGVDELEGGAGYANTTWFLDNVLTNNLCFDKRDISEDPTNWHWGDSQIRDYLNNYFLNNLFPQELVPYLKPVIKYTRSLNEITETVMPNFPTVDKLWLPSYYELVGEDYDTMETIGNAKYAKPLNNITFRYTYGTTTRRDYWLRSYNATYGDSSGSYRQYRYASSSIDGSIGAIASSGATGIAFGFCL